MVVMVSILSMVALAALDVESLDHHIDRHDNSSCDLDSHIHESLDRSIHCSDLISVLAENLKSRVDILPIPHLYRISNFSPNQKKILDRIKLVEDLLDQYLYRAGLTG